MKNKLKAWKPRALRQTGLHSLLNEKALGQYRGRWSGAFVSTHVYDVLIFYQAMMPREWCFTLFVAARTANKTRTLRMCGILTPATARYVMCSFHFLIWKRGRRSTSSCQCRVKPVTVVCDREQAWLPSNSHRPCPLPCQHMGALYIQQPSDSALRILQKNFLLTTPNKIRSYTHTHVYMNDMSYICICIFAWCLYIWLYTVTFYLKCVIFENIICIHMILS